MDKRTEAIISKAGRAEGLELDECMHLLSFAADTSEADEMRKAGFELAHSIADGKGYIHAQIGVDSHPCKENCRFCSFAAINRKSDDACFEIDLPTLREYAAFFSEQGVNLISLMATAGLDFDTLLRFVEEARSVIDDDMILLVNGPDLTLEQTRALAHAGAQAAYHALRLDEGIITDIKPAQRLRTIDNIHEAHLALMTGVEPLWEGIEEQKIAEQILLMPTLKPLWMGVCRLHALENTAMGHFEPVSMERLSQIGAITRLAVGAQVPIGGMGGVIWVDAGADPRCRGREDALAQLEKSIDAARNALRNGGWNPTPQKASKRLLKRVAP